MTAPVTPESSERKLHMKTCNIHGTPLNANGDCLLCQHPELAPSSERKLAEEWLCECEGNDDPYPTHFEDCPAKDENRVKRFGKLIAADRAAIVQETLRASAEECDRHAKFCKHEAENGGNREHLMARYAEANWNAQKILALATPAILERVAERDRQVREAALEEAAEIADSCRHGVAVAESIRTLKNNPTK
jgi:hypothetical protein